MKVFISQPMKDKTNEQILEARDRALGRVKEKFPNEEIELIDSFFKDAPHDARPLWFLGKSLELLSTADIAVFVDEWHKYRGCYVEHLCAINYDIKIEYV